MIGYFFGTPRTWRASCTITKCITTRIESIVRSAARPPRYAPAYPQLFQPRLTVTRGSHIAAVCFRLRSPPDLYFATHKIGSRRGWKPTRLCAALDHIKGRRDILDSPDFRECDAEAKRPGRRLNLIDLRLGEWIARIGRHRQSAKNGYNLTQEFETLRRAVRRLGSGNANLATKVSTLTGV